MTELDTWTRQHYRDGGGDPFLFYVAYGQVDTSEALLKHAGHLEDPDFNNVHLEILLPGADS